ncbi:uncharacterized protein LOC135215331 [Macrobrachium nipponense]|uniref:uncharacterized protein LOC135215331 n=1 Tax=Macrobrachium nipponense TaxID=159736 RepID=UPI0030C82716
MGNNSSSELSADEVATQVRHHYYYGVGAPNSFIRKVKTGHDHEAGEEEEEVAGDATTTTGSPQQCNPRSTSPPPTTEGNEQPGEDCHVIQENVQASNRHDESSSPPSDPDPFAEDFPLDEFDLSGEKKVNNNEA